MELLFVNIAIASAAYGAAILIYNGLTSFLWFWPLFAAVNLVMFGLIRCLRRKRREKEDVNLRPFVYFFTTYALGIIVLLALLAAIFSHARSSGLERNLDYVIVLGTDLRDNKVSPSLRLRLERARQYYKDNPNTTFILSGGRGEYDRSTEATVMYYYLVRSGVPEKNLLMEFYSDSTLEKIGFSLQAIQQDYQERVSRGPAAFLELPEDHVLRDADDRPLSVRVLTSEFNLYRAVLMAHHFGFQNVYSIGTPSDELMIVHLSVREAAAILKDRIAGNI